MVITVFSSRIQDHLDKVVIKNTWMIEKVKNLALISFTMVSVKTLCVVNFVIHFSMPTRKIKKRVKSFVCKNSKIEQTLLSLSSFNMKFFMNMKRLSNPFLTKISNQLDIS